MNKNTDNKDEEKSLRHYIGLGIALGAGIGTALMYSLSNQGIMCR